MKPNETGPRRKDVRHDRRGRHPALRSSLFHEDGCIRGNRPHEVYMVVLKPGCPHTKLAGAILMVNATDAGAAREFVETYMRMPQLVVAEVSLLCPPHPEGSAWGHEAERLEQQGAGA